jgi:EmrB/QacA subfamily drug resistance transporter
MARASEAGSEPRAAELDREVLLPALVVVLGTIMTVLDLTVVNVAIPTLGRDLGTSVATIQWVMTGYMLAFASVIPISGWASERFGAKQVWLASLGMFLLGSVLAGSAWSIGSLVGFRVLQGLGAGMILPVGQTILAQKAGPQRMGRVMSVIGVPMLLAPVFGPVLGGAIIGAASWRWIFLLNLPVGAAAVFAAMRLLPDTRPQRGQRLDLRGLMLLSPGIAIFLYGLAQAAAQGSFTAASTIATTIVGLALVGLFVWHALRRGSGALIDPSLFRRRGFAAAAALNLLLGVALFGSLILLPLYYQLVRHESPLQVGLLVAPQGLGAAVAMPLAGWLTDKIGARIVVTAGMLIAILGMFAFAQLGAHTSYAYLAAALCVLGVGIGSTIMPSMAAAFQTLTGQETPRAASALNVIQRIAGAVGTALLAITLQRTITSNLPQLHGGIQAIAALSPKQQAHAAAPLAAAFATAFWIAVALTSAALLPALFLPKRVRQEQTAGRARRARKAESAA